MPELWPAVLAKLCALVGGWAGGLLAFDPEQHTNFTATPNYVEAFTAFAENSDHYDNRRPKRALASGHAGFLHDLEMFSQADLERLAQHAIVVYEENLRAHGEGSLEHPSDSAAKRTTRLEHG